MGTAPSERRAGQDRRGADRRAQDRRAQVVRRRGRRRRETPTPYTGEQIAELRRRFQASGPVACPACSSSFTLGPARRNGAELARRVVCLGCGRAAAVPHSRAARVLVIAQQTERRDAMQALLTSAGHEAVEAADAAVGLRAYQAVPADVVFIDVQTPGRMQAPEFLRHLRRLFPDARVVALAGRSSFTGVDPLAVVQGLGAVRTLRMPATGEDVLRALEDARR